MTKRSFRKAQDLLRAFLPYQLVLYWQQWRKTSIDEGISKRRELAFENYLSTTKTPKLHIGCGPYQLKSWFNTDLEPDPGAFYLDATKKFPFRQHTFDYIFSEHFIEHISLDHCHLFLRESFRVLKPGGIIRIATPDLTFVLGLYRAAQPAKIKTYLRWYASRWHPAEKRNPRPALIVINGYFHNFGHQYLHDFKSLKDELNRAGFVNVRRYSAGKSPHTDLKNIESHGKTVPSQYNALESLVVEAQKPSSSITKKGLTWV